MNGDRHYLNFGVRYQTINSYDRGAEDEELKQVGQHKRFVTATRRGAKKCGCKPDKNRLKCIKKSPLDKKGIMKKPRGSCPNASYHYECIPEVCGAGCQNQALRNFRAAGRLPPVRIKNSGICGLGLFSNEDIPENTVLGEYTGLVKCHEKGVTNVGSHYVFGLGTGFKKNYDLIVDAEHCGNYLRYCNHSCKPNCSTQEIIVDRSFHILVKTNKKIPKNTQLTISYGKGYFVYGLICHCGTKNCLSKPPGSADGADTSSTASSPRQ